LTFLTRLPIGNRVLLDADDATRSGPSFPLVGALLGAVVGGATALLAAPLTPLPAAVVAVGIGVLLTGALHLDGFADAVDALAGRTRERALEIMRDHALGSYGAVALGLDLLLKVTLLAALVPHHRVLRFAVVAGALSRLAPVLLATCLPYARRGAGAGAALTRGGFTRALVAVGLAAAVAAASAGLEGLALLAAVLALTAGLGLIYRRWLGGVTGDLLGAASELSELLVLACAVAFAQPR
jgi:adenosylcobinamide-GDP ribazoletransferase